MLVGRLCFERVLILGNKYGEIKTKVDGITFDSKLEADYYRQLVEKKLNGDIEGFELQPKFLLQPGFKKNGKTYQAIHYIADFKVIDYEGNIQIIDVKGVETEKFKIKHKMFEYLYPELSLSVIKGESVSGSEKRKPSEAKKRAARKEVFRKRRSVRARFQSGL